MWSLNWSSITAQRRFKRLAFKAWSRVTYKKRGLTLIATSMIGSSTSANHNQACESSRGPRIKFMSSESSSTKKFELKILSFFLLKKYLTEKSYLCLNFFVRLGGLHKLVQGSLDLRPVWSGIFCCSAKVLFYSLCVHFSMLSQSRNSLSSARSVSSCFSWETRRRALHWSSATYAQNQ